MPEFIKAFREFYLAGGWPMHLVSTSGLAGLALLWRYSLARARSASMYNAIYCCLITQFTGFLGGAIGFREVEDALKKLGGQAHNTQILFAFLGGAVTPLCWALTWGVIHGIAAGLVGYYSVRQSSNNEKGAK